MSASQIKVRCEDRVTMPRTGKVVDFYNALQIAEGIYDKHGKLERLNDKEIFTVLRVQQSKCIARVTADAVTPVTSRAGRLFFLNDWPEEGFVSAATIDHKFFFERVIPDPLTPPQSNATQIEDVLDELDVPEPNYDYTVEVSGELNERYQIQFQNEQQAQMLRYQETAPWYKAIMQIIDRLVLGSESRRVKVTLHPNIPGCTDYHYNTIITVDGQRIGTMLVNGKIVPAPHLDNSSDRFGLSFYVELIGAGPEVVREASPKAPVRDWIPQMNQFVRVEGEDELYVIADYDLYKNMFILTIADSARREREARLGGMSDRDYRMARASMEDPHIRVEPGRLRPFTLRY